MPSDRRVALLARDLVWEDAYDASVPFSYAVSKLEASLRSAPDLKDVEVRVIDLQSDDPDAFMAEIEAFKPTMVGTSTYIWSAAVFGEVARRVKRWNPRTGFMMGGPAARPSVFALPPYAPNAEFIDGLVTGEGEEVIRAAVRAHSAAAGDDGWARNIAGMHVRSPNGPWQLTAPQQQPCINRYASPYHLGIVPRGGVGYLESFRGCPMRCSFCQWGDARPDRVHDEDYLVAHLEGLKASKVDLVYVVDAAFNLSPRAFRNLAAAERQVRALADCKVLGHLYPTVLTDDHLAFFDGLGQAEINMGLQSIHPELLTKLGRPFDVERFHHVIGQVRQRYRVSVEIILGLPGDTPEGFRHTLERSIELADRVRVFYCLALPDAMLETAAADGVDFDPTTFEVISAPGWSASALQSEWRRVRDLAVTMHRAQMGPNWCEFDTTHPAPAPEPARPQAPPAFPESLRDRLQDAISGTAMGWRLGQVRGSGEHLLLDLSGRTGQLVLEIAMSHPAKKRFSEHDGIAYSYRGDAPTDTADLADFIARLHARVYAHLPSMLHAPSDGP